MKNEGHNCKSRFLFPTCGIDIFSLSYRLEKWKDTHRRRSEQERGRRRKIRNWKLRLSCPWRIGFLLSSLTEISAPYLVSSAPCFIVSETLNSSCINLHCCSLHFKIAFEVESILLQLLWARQIDLRRPPILCRWVIYYVGNLAALTLKDTRRRYLASLVISWLSYSIDV